jgi:hypothetical protein
MSFGKIALIRWVMMIDRNARILQMISVSPIELPLRTPAVVIRLKGTFEGALSW